MAMTEHAPDGTETKEPAGAESGRRVFLVVVDESAELRVALLFACLRAKKTGGRVALLYVMEPADFQHWMAVKDLMDEERRAAAEEVLQKAATLVKEWSGEMPILYVREGQVRDELQKLVELEPHISILVLGAGTGADGPGPLVSSLAGKASGRFRIPITIVPGSLSDEDVEALS